MKEVELDSEYFQTVLSEDFLIDIGESGNIHDFICNYYLSDVHVSYFLNLFRKSVEFRIIVSILRKRFFPAFSIGILSTLYAWC